MPARIDNIDMVLDVYDEVGGRRNVKVSVKEPPEDSPLYKAVYDAWVDQFNREMAELYRGGSGPMGIA